MMVPNKETSCFTAFQPKYYKCVRQKSVSWGWWNKVDISILAFEVSPESAPQIVCVCVFVLLMSKPI